MRLTLDLTTQSLSGGGFRPAILFRGGAAGALFEPANLSSLYQDAAGTIPVAQPGDPVGLMLDRSGNGNHVRQATAAKCPIFAIEPAGGKRNLLTDTDDFTADSWAKTGATPLPESSVSFTGGTNARMSQSVYARPNGAYTLSARVRLVAGTPAPNAATLSIYGGGALVQAQAVSFGTELLAAGGAFISVSVTAISSSEGGSITGQVRCDTPGVTLQLEELQFEAGSVPTNYQKVGNKYNVTEAGTRTLRFLSFDGVDDVMDTGSPIAALGTATFLGAAVKEGVASLIAGGRGGFFGDASYRDGGTMLGFGNGLLSGITNDKDSSYRKDVAPPVTGTPITHFLYTGLGSFVQANDLRVSNLGDNLLTPPTTALQVGGGAQIGWSRFFQGNFYGGIYVNKEMTSKETGASQEWLDRLNGRS
jgi:hypothetical protein